jgi:hypothetical protein
MISVHVKVTPEKGSKLDKQVTFATALALTAVAKESQTASIKDIESTFTVRNNWDKPSNKFGIRITPATKDNLASAVRTDADWLIPHEDGGTKQPEGHALAVPTANVRRTKRQMIQRSQRPRALLGKRDVVLRTRSGPVLFQRRGGRGRSKLVPLYNLEPKAVIKKQSTVLEPTRATVEKRFGALFADSLAKAIRTAK